MVNVNKSNITQIEGDVTEVECDVILHQVNCQGVMGSGVAKTIRDKFPEVYKEYVTHVIGSGELKSYLLGTIQLCKTNRGNYVANMFSQDNYGYGKQHTDYDAMRKALKGLNDYCRGKTIALPYKLGSDRGGGDWNTVLQIIKESLTDCNVIIVKYRAN